jgi:serine protease SohB
MTCGKARAENRKVLIPHFLFNKMASLRLAAARYGVLRGTKSIRFSPLSYISIQCHARQLSSLNDIADLLNPGRKKTTRRLDELDSINFIVTRLNDTMTGARSTLLDAVVGPAAGDAERETARRKRTGMAFHDLLTTIPEGQKRDAVASALTKFEENEVKRKDTLRLSLNKWREEQLATSEKKKPETFFSRQFSYWFQRGTQNFFPQKAFEKQLKNEAKLFKDLKKAGVDLETVQKIVSDASTVMDTFKGNQLTVSNSSVDRPQFVYVLDFKGDTQASKATELAEVISALLSLPKSLIPSEVVLRLKSPGGTVPGYGKASTELGRLRKANVSLTVCVDEVAASGGYLMASVANKIYAAPFAAIGSIGVVASTPNVARRMKDEGVSVIQQTAGKYKRTVTPWKEPEQEELDKLQEDVDTIQKHFVSHVAMYRGDRIADATEIATGEVWYGADALEKGLVDELMTSEEYIQSRIEGGCEVLHVKKVSPRMPIPWWLSASGNTSHGMLGSTPGSWNLPMLQNLNGAFFGEESGQDASDEEFSIGQLSRIVESLPSRQRRDLVKALLRQE